VLASLAAAFVVLIAYLAGLGWLISQEGGGDTMWTRSVSIISGLQTLAFAAAGWFWGTQVNRGAAEVAQHNAEQTRGELEKARNDVAQQAELRRQAEGADAARKERYRAAYLAAQAFIPSMAAADGDAGHTAGAGAGHAEALTANGADRLLRYLRDLDPEATQG
jgi:hypothetical protein